MSFQFGNLPYGYNPYSNSMTTMGGAFGDSPVWNLADSQVQSQMTGPLFANMPSCNFQPRPVNNNSGNFYNNLLMSQAIASGSSTPDSGKMMGDLFQMMIMMKQLEKMNEVSSSTSSRRRSKDYEDDDNYKYEYETNVDEYDDEDNDDEDEPVIPAEKVFKFDENKPLVGLKGFIKNENEDSTFKYGSFDKFAKKSYSAIGKEHSGHVTLRETLKTFGINMDDLSDSQQKEIKSLTNLAPNVVADLSNSKEKFKSDDIFLTDTTYKKILGVLGFSQDNSSISRGDLELNTDKLSDDESEIDSPEELSEKRIPKAKIENAFTELRGIVSNKNADELGEADIQKVKDIIKRVSVSDKEAVREFLRLLETDKYLKGENGTKTVLGSIFTTLVENDTTESSDSANIESFNKDILTPLKEASAKHGLGTEWNKSLASLGSADKSDDDMYKMMDEVTSELWWRGSDATSLKSVIRNAKIYGY